MDYTGQLLIARPLNRDPWFRRSVVLIYESNRAGTVGVVLNQRTTVSVQTICAQNNYLYTGSDYVYRGGPVNERALIMVHTPEWSCPNTLQVNEHFSITSHDSMFKQLAVGDMPRKWRICSGVSAWSDEQIQGEMAGETPWTPEHSWLVARATQTSIFEIDGEKQWNYAIELAGRQMINSYF